MARGGGPWNGRIRPAPRHPRPRRRMTSISKNTTLRSVKRSRRSAKQPLLDQILGGAGHACATRTGRPLPRPARPSPGRGGAGPSLRRYRCGSPVTICRWRGRGSLPGARPADAARSGTRPARQRTRTCVRQAADPEPPSSRFPAKGTRRPAAVRSVRRRSWRSGRVDAC